MTWVRFLPPQLRQRRFVLANAYSKWRRRDYSNGRSEQTARGGEVIRPDEEPVLKTGAANHRCGFESHGFRSREPTTRAHGPTGRHRRRKPEIRVRFPVSPLHTIPWSSGDDFWPTPRQRWFESIRDHSFKRPRYANPAERLGSVFSLKGPSVCGFDSRLGHIR